MKNRGKNIRGITLVALVVTIVVLLILAGITISYVMGDNSIFKKTQEARLQTEIAKAREKLELVLNDAMIQKYDNGLTEKELDNKINEIGEILPNEDSTSNYQQVVVDGYIFEIDRSMPKVVDYVGKADGVIITAVLSNNKTDGWVSAAESKASITGTIRTYSGGKIKAVSVKRDEQNIGNLSIDKDGKYEIANITESGTYTIYAEDSNKKTNSKEIKVEVKIDKTAPTVENINVITEGAKIKISATGHDKNALGQEESGIKEFNYIITPADGAKPETGTVKGNEIAEITITKWVVYTIKVTATDKCNNKNEIGLEKKVDMKDTTPPTITNAKAEAEMMKIKISATTTDDKSGVKQINYTVSPSTITPKSGTIQSGQEIELTATEMKEYTITFTATDNSGNISVGVIKKATASDAMSVETAKKLVTNMETLKEYMGKKVNYKTGETWMIFYYDQEGEFGPQNTLYLKKAFGSTDSKLTASSKRANSDPAVAMMRNMNPDWAKSEYSAVDNQGEYYCVWLCDPTVWNTYRNPVYSSYAIGCPSVEMYARAYNLWMTEEEQLVCKVTKNTGYQFRRNGGTSSVYSNSFSFDTTATEKNPIFKSPSSKEYYFASPHKDRKCLPSSFNKLWRRHERE